MLVSHEGVEDSVVLALVLVGWAFLLTPLFPNEHLLVGLSDSVLRVRLLIGRGVVTDVLRSPLCEKDTQE